MDNTIRTAAKTTTSSAAKDRTAAEPLLGSRYGKLLLTLLCAVAFLDFVDASIVNLALPDLRTDLDFSVQELQWVPSGYLLTYGGFMLLGGRLADLLGRRRVLVSGTVLIGISSLTGGLATDSGVLVGARLAQGLGAALMLPAALSLLTTNFKEGSDRNTALGVWGGVGGLASAVGVLLGGLLTEGPGWRWVFLFNPVACALVIPAVLVLIPRDRRRERTASFDALGGILVTGAMLTLVFALVRAPLQGWADPRTLAELGGAAVLLIAFVLNERRHHDPLLPLSIFRVRGLVAADTTGLIAFAGLIAMFFFLTLYMQTVLGYSPIQTGSAYLPLCFGVGIAAGIASQLTARIGTRPIIVTGALLASAGLFLLSRIPVDGSYLSDLLPGLMIVSLGLGGVFVGVTTAANAGVSADRAGLAAALLNASQQVGSALGLAIFSAVATSRTNDLLAARSSLPQALTSGFSRALLTGSVLLLAAAAIALRTHNAHSDLPVATEESGAVMTSSEGPGTTDPIGNDPGDARRELSGHVDFTMMYAAHDAFTRDLGRLLAGGVGREWQPGDHDRWSVFTTQLHIHHQAEDAALWPPLREQPLSPDEVATLDAMEQEHEQIDPQLDRVEAALAAGDAEARSQSLRQLSNGLAAHMRHEENVALPMIETRLGPQGWARFTASFRETQGIRGAAVYFPWLLQDAPPDVRRKVLGVLPGPARLLYRLRWEPAYHRSRRARTRPPATD